MESGQTSFPGVGLDDMDIRMLNLLQADGRLSVRELARRIGMSSR